MGVAGDADSEAGGGAGGGAGGRAGGGGGAGPDSYITTGYQVAKKNIIIVLQLLSILLVPLFFPLALKTKFFFFFVKRPKGCQIVPRFS